jgi:hypothetical protein
VTDMWQAVAGALAVMPLAGMVALWAAYVAAFRGGARP